MLLSPLSPLCLTPWNEFYNCPRISAWRKFPGHSIEQGIYKGQWTLIYQETGRESWVAKVTKGNQRGVLQRRELHKRGSDSPEDPGISKQELINECIWGNRSRQGKSHQRGLDRTVPKVHGGAENSACSQQLRVTENIIHGVIEHYEECLPQKWGYQPWTKHISFPPSAA